ncbi:unnamed protein product [Fraxinus pennsylvanica]|uniref:Protein kinase domain-containing protein n=1 Tax=Fraxinus pennsylvanica TaxID=56036 RepID=A0AAD1ZMM1_9LAMI|nr:unnamed protein product [Fraxinus pennsylvanica]
MTTPFTAAIIIVLTAVSSLSPSANALGGSATTVAVVYGSATTICTIIAQQPLRQIQCWQNGQLLSPIIPTTSFDYIAGGLDTLCATRSGGFSLLCWNTTFNSKRMYNNYSAPLTSLTIGDTQICGLTNISSRQNVICWRGNGISSVQNPNGTLGFRSISSGLGFSCGVLEGNNRVLCWGDDNISVSIQSDFSNFSMLNIQVGGRHACGMDNSGLVICKGNNDNGQLDVPSNSSYEYIGLALGLSHSCAIRRLNRTVVCWGEFSSNVTDGISFESIVAGLNFTCGLTTSNLSVICWGSGWPNQFYPSGQELPLQKSLPGPCVETPCECNLYPQTQTLCSGNGHICWPCDITVSISPPSLPSPSPPVVSPSHSPSKRLRRGLLAFAIVGSVGGFAGICTVIYCLWTGVCFGKKKIHNSVQPTISGAPQSNSSPPSRSSTLRRQGSILMRRQRSGTSSKHADRAEEFLFLDLAAATNNFSLENKIGAGSFGVVYKGKLADGREVAIKRTKSDVYGLGVVLLELLTGKRALFKTGENGGGAPITVVDYAVPAIMSGELAKILDPRVGPLEINESEAVELVAYTAMHCVHLEGKDRPTMNDIVANLERALALCDDSHGSISSGPISIVSD